jgi:hypothetical protein
MIDYDTKNIKLCMVKGLLLLSIDGRSSSGKEECRQFVIFLKDVGDNLI